VSRGDGRPGRRPDKPGEGYDGQGALYTFALGICIFLLVGAVSIRQATAPENATRTLESGIASLSEIDILLAQNGEDFRTFVRASNEQSFLIPGYPLDVFLTRDEVLNSSDDELRAIVLERSSALVYHDGLGAFDRTGNQSLGFFSTEGLVEQFAGMLSETTYDRATIASGVLVVLSGIAGVLVVLRHRGFRRMGMLGIATTAAAIPGYAGSFAAAWILGGIGGDDAFSEDLRAIVESVMEIPKQNYLIALFAGVAVTLGAILLGVLNRYLGDPASPDASEADRAAREPRPRWRE
jgi:hypothetical protein